MENRRQFAKRAALLALAGGAPAALTGCPTLAQWEAIVIANIPAIIQVVTGILTIAGDPSVPADLEDIIRNTTQQIAADLNLAKTYIQNYQAHPTPALLGQIDGVLLDAQTNINELLQAFHVDNQQLQATISAAIGLAIGAIVGLEALIPPPPVPSAMRAYLAYGSGQNAIKTSFNLIVQKHYQRNMIRD